MAWYLPIYAEAWFVSKASRGSGQKLGASMYTQKRLSLMDASLIIQAEVSPSLPISLVGARAKS